MTPFGNYITLRGLPTSERWPRKEILLESTGAWGQTNPDKSFLTPVSDFQVLPVGEIPTGRQTTSGVTNQPDRQTDRLTGVETE